MRKKQKLCATFAVCVILALVSSCSRPPSDDTIQSAISDYLKHGVWCANAQIELIEIKQIGKFNDQPRWWEEHKYWPVKARIKGTCEKWPLLSTKRITKAIDQDDDFKLYQDDYGNWKAYQ